MTDSHDDFQPDDSPADSKPENATPIETPSAPAVSDAAPDDLPETEELTPELIEEEAIRGDFMLRWAAIFLTILFAFALIADTQVLTHIRSGEALASDGFLPYQKDTLSYAAPDQPLGNTTWLFDILVALVYGAGGQVGLTVIKVMISGFIAWVLSRISVSMMPTWWNSICCVFAAAAICNDLLPITDLVTLLGMTILLAWLHRLMEGNASGLLWKMPMLLVVWANLDSRAYLGLFAVVLFAIGCQLTKKTDTADEPNGPSSAVLFPNVGLTILLCLMALFVNPYPVVSGLSVITTYTVEYPNMATLRPTKIDAPAIQDGRSEFHSLLSSEVWHGFEFSYLAGVCLLGIASIVLILNRSRRDLPWCVTLLGMSLLTLLAVRELSAVALIAAVVAGTSAQRWYSRTFRQEYSVDSAEVMFSRGGRAATVLGMALIGFCVVADRLPTRTAIGIGFDPQLKATLTSLEEQLKDVPEQKRMFNTILSQGDLLIWNGRQSFVDSRTRLFGRVDAEKSVMRTFETLRLSLIPLPKKPEPKPGEKPIYRRADKFYDANWSQIYNKYQISKVMLRLSPPGPPAYAKIRQFYQDPHWTADGRGPSAAFFRYSAIGNEKSEAPAAKLVFNLDESIDDKQLTKLDRRDYAQPPGFYQKYLYLKRPTLSAPLREAEHTLNLDSMAGDQVSELAAQFRGDPTQSEQLHDLGDALATPLLAIRRTNEAMELNPNDSRAFAMQARAYRQLDEYEQRISQAGRGQAFPVIRYYQCVMAIHQSLRSNPEQDGLQLDLAQIYQQRNKFDLSLKYLQQFLKKQGDALIASEDTQKQAEGLYAWEASLIKADEEMSTHLDKERKKEFSDDPAMLAMQHYEIASGLNLRGFVLKSLEYMQENEALLLPLPEARVLKGSLLLEVGELEEGFQLLNGVAQMATDPKYETEYLRIQWQLPVVLSHLGKGAYAEAQSILQSQYDTLVDPERIPQQAIGAILQTLPLVPAIEVPVSSPLPLWPLLTMPNAQMPMATLPSLRASTLLQMAVLNLESGRITEAKQQLEELARTTGMTQSLSLAAVYLLQFEGNTMEEFLETRANLFEPFEFPEEREDDQSKKEKTEDVQAEDGTNTPNPIQ